MTGCLRPVRLVGNWEGNFPDRVQSLSGHFAMAMVNYRDW